SGLSRDSIVIQSIECLKSQRILNIFKNLKFNSQTVKEGNPWQEYDKKANFKLIELLDKYPKSEPGMVYQLSKHISQANLYLGNSMPIRQWDLVASTKNHLKDVLANRGANGIDGQLSTFLGWAKESDENWAIVGDLTALYDLSALWIENQIPVKNIKIVVINNHGGMIFNRMFKSEYFLNRHELDFSSWANMWEWSYVKWEQIPSGDMNISDRAVIELQPDSMQTTFFWQEWDKI
ncbi:MAG: hypothetical protein KDD45_13600, partial [Bdellovibrionales bacterium]|nr:hypothetical protein [Bdellovibrionales bacterium]